MQALVRFGIELSEQGVVPEVVLRAAIRRLCAQRLAESAGSSPQAAAARQARFRAALDAGPLALHTDDSKAQHYELPAEYFELVLGPRRKYSCCYWDDTTPSLAAAEDESLRRVCTQAQLADGQRILDLGCGWGSLTLWLAEHYPRAQITAVSHSRGQRAAIERQLAARGFTNVTVLTLDVGAGELPTRLAPGSFERIVSLEMIEHMRNWSLLLQQLHALLAEQGKLYLHHFCHRQYAYPFEVQDDSDWLTEHFFRGGIMPSYDLAAACAGPLRVEQQWRWTGTHYQRTARAWLAQHAAARAPIMRLFQEHYGAAAARWFQRWRIFYLAVDELFGFADGQEWQVVHTLLGKDAAPGTST